MHKRTTSSIDLGPLCSPEWDLDMQDDGAVISKNGEHVESIPENVLVRYEKASIKCDCRKQAKLVWSKRNQKCFFVCRDGGCKYVRRFADVWDTYLPEDDLLFTYG
jgi:hypothetical protein